MEDMIIELVKISPAISAIVVVVWMGIRHVDRMDVRSKESADKFVEAIKDIGEKCHHAHDKNAQMFYEQSCNGQKILGELTVQLALFAQAQRELSDAVKVLRRG